MIYVAAGFRDPFVFESPKLVRVLANTTSSANPTTAAAAANSTTTTNSTSSNLFATVSGGVRGIGSKLLLYRQATVGDFLDWQYVGPIFETALNQSWSIWSGSTSFFSLLSSPDSIFSLPIRSSLFSPFERCAAGQGLTIRRR